MTADRNHYRVFIIAPNNIPGNRYNTDHLTTMSTKGANGQTGHLHLSVLSSQHCGVPSRAPDDCAYLEFVAQRLKNKGLGSHEPIHLSLFKGVLGIEKESFADRFFRILDRERKGYLFGDELLPLLSSLTDTCFCKKLKLLFDIYDADGNGTIDQNEFSTILTRSITGNSFAFSQQQVEHLTKTLFAAIDKDLNGVVSFDELVEFLDESPELLSRLKISISRFFRPPASSKRFGGAKAVNRWFCPYFLLPSYARRYPREAVFGWTYVLSVLAFFTYGFVAAWFSKKAISTRPCTSCFAFAKAFGKTLNWTSTLAITLMLKEILTRLRNTGMGRFFPIDSSVYAHKVNGYLIMVCVVGHIVMHFANYGCLTFYNNILQTTDNQSAVNTTDVEVVPTVILSYSLEITAGWISLVAAVLVCAGSLPCVRRSGHFEGFFYTHLVGYLVYFVTLLIHAKNNTFWIYIAVPGLLYLIEKIHNAWTMYIVSSCEVMVQKVVQWPSGVTQLTLERPPNFSFNPGDYILIKIPNLAWFEWHPFTISSCPEDKGVLTLHIRSAGDWTRRLYDYFKFRLRLSVIGGELQPSTKRVFNRRSRISILHKKRQSMKGQVLGIVDIKANIKGPYGTPSGRIFEAEHAVLICAGIGVTPYASILQSIVAKHRAAVAEYGSSHGRMSLGKLCRLTKVDFIWVINNQRNLEWFVELLEELDAEQHGEARFHNFLSIEIYVTSATKMADLDAFALTSALETFYKKYNRDLITGIGSRAKHGRPNWEAVFNLIDENKNGAVSVFFCGPHSISRDLRRYSNLHNFAFFKESF